MNFQSNLFNRKGRFGTLWLAAHHPTKIGKTEIIHLDLTKKCKEVVEYILNGKVDKPRFSLYISSHLMFGLCVILKKQNQYLYEELVYLNHEIHKSYITQSTLIKPVVKKAAGKTPKKVQHVEQQVVTLKENLPDIDLANLTSFELFYQAESDRLNIALEQQREQVQVATRPITLEETFDIYDRSTLIPTGGEFDFLADSFGASIIVAEMPKEAQKEIALPQPPQVFLEDTYFSAENLEKTVQRPGVTSTVRFSDRVQALTSREPFRELSTNEQLRRAELTSKTQNLFEEESTIFNELESLLSTSKQVEVRETRPEIEIGIENIPPTELGITPAMPELYQETLIEQEAQMELPQVQPPQEEARPSPRLEEESALIAEMAKQRLKRKEKKRALIIDQKTEFTAIEMRKRMREETNVGEGEDKKREALDKLFEKTRGVSLKASHDYLMQDLIHHPSSLLMRNTRKIYTQHDLNSFVKCKLILRSKNLESLKQPDDSYFYTTEYARPAEAQPVREELPEQPVVSETITAEQSELERGRRAVKEQRGGRLSRFESGIMARSSARKSTLTEQVAKEHIGPTRLQFEESSSYHQYQEQTQFEAPQDLTLATPLIAIQPATPIAQRVEHVEYVEQPVAEAVSDKDEYERIILGEIGKAGLEGKKAVLQDIVRDCQMTETCLRAAKPRRMFAAKMLMQTLNMCKESQIKASQDKMYAQIELDI